MRQHSLCSVLWELGAESKQLKGLFFFYYTWGNASMGDSEVEPPQVSEGIFRIIQVAES